MIGISKLYCGQVEPSDALRYGRHSSQLPSHLLQFSEDKKPVVVWNMTRRCNLKCVHCYAQAVDPDGKDEISTEQGKAIISDLAAYGAPVMLFSGGEPLVRQDLPELASYATEKGMRAVISTNGTLITKEKARELKAINLSYVASRWTAPKKSTTSSAVCRTPSRRRLRASKIARPRASRSACASPSISATWLKSPKSSSCCANSKCRASASTTSYTPAAAPK